MKSLTVFVHLVLNDLGTRCNIASTSRDFKTVTARVEDEGLSFLTITLADFGADFQKSLDQGHVGSNQFSGFRKAGGLPAFLQGFLRRIFNPKTGRLLDDPCLHSIHAVRQFTLMWAKIGIECTPARERAAMRGFIECESQLKEADRERAGDDLARFTRISALLWARIFSNVDGNIYVGDVLPKHGPGSTSDGVLANRKYDHQDWTRRLDDIFPSTENIIPSFRFLHEIEGLELREPEDEIPVKVISVPKTQRTPRIIAVEPTCMQYMQQGILEQMVDQFRADDNARNFVLSDSQVPNQVLAHKGSRDGTLATLDLSEASDRVSNQLVRAMLKRHPWLALGVDATRSRKADVQGHGVVRLSKFASMGSALCFPMESLVFCTVVFAGIERALSRQLTDRDVKSLYGRVRVYGDDIIVPVEYAVIVMQELENFGFRVNTRKSFWTGKFRESCGRDYYDGHDVSIVRVRSLFPASRLDVPELVSTVALRNNLANSGWCRFPEAVAWLDDMIGKIIPFPVVEPTSQLLGRHDALPFTVGRWDGDLHTPLVKGAWSRARIPSSPLDGYGALMKALLKRGDQPVTDEGHLERAGRPVSVSIKSGWATPY